MKEKIDFLQKLVSLKLPEGLMFTKPLFSLKSDDFSGSLMFKRKLMYSFSPDILAFTLETQKLTRTEHHAIFEAKISIGDVFAFTPFRYQDFTILSEIQ